MTEVCLSDIPWNAPGREDVGSSMHQSLFGVLQGWLQPNKSQQHPLPGKEVMSPLVYHPSIRYKPVWYPGPPDTKGCARHSLRSQQRRELQILLPWHCSTAARRHPPAHAGLRGPPAPVSSCSASPGQQPCRVLHHHGRSHIFPGAFPGQQAGWMDLSTRARAHSAPWHLTEWTGS